MEFLARAHPNLEPIITIKINITMNYFQLNVLFILLKLYLVRC